MAEEILRSRHAFGNENDVDAALSAGKIDAYDILFLTTEDGKHKIGWIDKSGNKIILDDHDTKQVLVVEELPETGESGKVYIFGEDGYFWNGEKFINLCKPTDVSALEMEIATKVTADEVNTMIKESGDSSVEIVEF